MMPFVAALSVIHVLSGVWLFVAGVVKSPEPSASRRRRRRPRGPLGTLFSGNSPTARRNRLLLIIGLVIGVVAFALSGWLVAVILVPAAFVGIPMLVTASEGKKSIERIEAMEEWTRSLSGVLGAGVGLEQAIQVTLSRSTPAPIRTEVATLVARLHARWPTSAALRAFADDLDDATGDGIVAGLILASERRGAGLATMLENTAERAAEDVRNRRRVEADLAKPRSTARWVTIITIVVLGIMALNGHYIAPYGTPVGQIVLVFLLTFYVAALLWMRQMARGEVLPRFLSVDDRSRTRVGRTA